jgi:hypothetical protein
MYRYKTVPPMELLFWFRKSRAEAQQGRGKKQFGMLVVELTVGPDRFGPRSTGIRCFRDEWHPDLKKFRGPRAELLTEKLADFEARLRHAKKTVDVSSAPVTPQAVWGAYLQSVNTHEKPTETRTVGTLWDECLAHQRQQVRAGELEQKTVDAYQTRRNVWRRYVVSELAGQDTPADEFDTDEFEAFALYLSRYRQPGGKPYRQTHRALMLQEVKRVLRWGIRKRYVSAERLKYVTVEAGTVPDPEVLTYRQYDQLRAVFLDWWMSERGSTRCKALHAFLVACEIGTHFADYFQIGDDDLRGDSEGRVYLERVRRKTKRFESRFRVYLSAYCQELVDLAGGWIELPRFSSDPYRGAKIVNAALKEAGAVAGLPFPLTFSVARNTYLSRLEQRGATDSVLARSAGWKAGSVGQLRGRYIRALDEDLLKYQIPE